MIQASVLIITMIITHGASAPVTNNGVEYNGDYTFSLLTDGLFEGDIKMSEDDILKYYNLSSIPGGENLMTGNEDDSNKDIGDKKNLEKRAATADNSLLWMNATVSYQFSPSIPTGLRILIRLAMDHWEDRTCLRFTARNGESDYVEYDNQVLDACFSSIGRVGGKQTINMGFGCGFGTGVHEIGHAIGFWHEQSRPDRDDYIRVNLTNVQAGLEHNFMKRTSSEINSRGSEYDYGSIMHYPTNAFVRDDCDGCQTIEITDLATYQAQGSPTLGQTDGLSVRDIQQANTLYSCPTESGVKGVLFVHIRNGQSLPDTDPAGDSPDPYVVITAVDSSGARYIRFTTVKSGTTSPEWNEDLKLPNREWQFFRIQVLDDDSSYFALDFTFGVGDPMSISETVVVTSGVHTNLRHYSRLGFFTDGYVSFDYTLQ